EKRGRLDFHRSLCIQGSFSLFFVIAVIAVDPRRHGSLTPLPMHTLVFLHTCPKLRQRTVVSKLAQCCDSRNNRNRLTQYHQRNMPGFSRKLEKARQIYILQRNKSEM
ncbi:unnamed protein product, partial [Ectocarpus sp. 13 AM-2016]